MGFPARWKSLSAGSGNLNAVAAGATTGGTAFSTANLALDTLSCLFTVLAETSTLTIAAKWQVSDDNSTWYDLVESNNPANVALATGTGGADVAVSRAIVCPSGALGWKYVRPAIVTGVTTGASADTYSFTLKVREFNGFA
jgi:hypothetical protein